jgi:serine/threonine protein kinase
MESDHWARVKEIFTEALDQSLDAREAFAHEACGADGPLLQDVLKLLDGHSRVNGTLSQPLFPPSLSELPEQPPRFSPSMVVARRFQIIRLIARGGMGEVYEAEDLQLGVRVALKTIRPEIAADERVLELFKKEIQTARRVTHPNVCRIYDLAQHSEPVAGQDDEVTIFLTMELLTGETLAERLKSHGPSSREEALPFIRQMASALQAAHEAGVIHRDFKPGNVMLSPGPGGNQRVVVTDFGLAVPRAQAQSQPLPGAAGGTPAYMAPEQLNGGEVTTATDVYALGLVIAEMVGARVQPAGASLVQTILHRGAAPSEVTLSLPQTFRRWEPVLLRCLEPEPAKRYSRPIAVAEALAAESTRRPVWTRPNTLATAAGLLVAVLGLTTSVAQRYTKWHPQNATTYRKLGPDEDNVSLWRPSPDGRYFAVTDWRTGNLGLRDIDTGDIRLLTSRAKTPAEGQALSAAFSPDGSRIAYSWLQNGLTELRIVETRTGEDTLLLRDPALTFCAVEDWSPDASRVLSHFEWQDSSDQIAVISVADRSVSFPLPKGTYGNMRFTPDSAHIVFNAPQRPQDFESDIFEVSIYGGPVETLVKNSANDNLIGFSRDGRRLIFSSDRKGTYGVWTVAFSGDATEGEPTVLAHDLGRAEPIGLTQDGTLYYTIATNSEDVYTAEIDIATGRLVSGPDNVVKRFRGSFRFPSWSADGRRMSFMYLLDGRPRLGIYSRETQEIHPLDLKLASFRRPQWDPSGDRIFVVGSDKSGLSGIFRVDANTGDAQLAIDARTLNGFEGAWAHDGHTLFDRFGDPKLGIFRLDIQTGRRQVLYVPPPGLDLGLENLALSPDESTLAFQVRQPATGASSLMVIPASGGPARPLLTIARPEEFLFGSFAWTADSKQILSVRTRDKNSELWLVPVDGGGARKIEFPSMRIVMLRMNPDGKTIAFTSGEPSGEVWMAENLLPAVGN